MANAIRIKAFGITREILGASEVTVDIETGETVADLRSHLESQYPSLRNLTSLFIAVNNQYAEDDAPLTSRDEVALIPPVSGG